MFERYTEKARRVMFFARYEASNFGSPYIESEHMLLGLLREDKTLANHFLKSHAAVDSIRTQIEQNSTIGEKTPTSVDLPLSKECKRALQFGAEESAQFGHKDIGTGHLLAGLLREEKCFAAELLRERGVELAKVREWLARDSPEEATTAQRAPLNIPDLARVSQTVRIPAKTLAELHRQAEARGIALHALVLSMIEKSLHQSPPPKDADVADIRETYHQLRDRTAAEGFPVLDAAQLEEEIARRKGIRH
jgi:ATP-dependent Clp protease ATP-binding subunit ClpA